MRPCREKSGRRANKLGQQGTLNFEEGLEDRWSSKDEGGDRGEFGEGSREMGNTGRREGGKSGREKTKGMKRQEEEEEEGGRGA